MELIQLQTQRATVQKYKSFQNVYIFFMWMLGNIPIYYLETFLILKSTFHIILETILLLLEYIKNATLKALTVMCHYIYIYLNW